VKQVLEFDIYNLNPVNIPLGFTASKLSSTKNKLVTAARLDVVKTRQLPLQKPFEPTLRQLIVHRFAAFLVFEEQHFTYCSTNYAAHSRTATSFS
jgi:hypothetical protein